jgi:hypothetical protein
MNRATDTIKLAFLCLAALSLSSCADMPHWLGGLSSARAVRNLDRPRPIRHGLD